MKFSVVIPTRNRLDLLKYAVTSIIKQNYADWEIIISDNASSEDIAGYIKSLNESRIKYSRSDEYLSITENWNQSMDLSSGDYTIMIGDDDILLKNYFQIACKLIENFNQPDLIYSNAFLYAYPGVIPSFPKGVFQPFGSLYGMPKHEAPFWLEQSTRRTLVQETLKFNSIYSTNMQHALIHRSLLEKVKREGKFFHSPYPDIYSMSALIVEADRILIYPKELVVIGISSKSHGCYAINRKDKEAIDFLNIKNEMSDIPTLEHILLPGFIVYTYWLGAIELFKMKFAIQKYDLDLDYNLYRNIQIKYTLEGFFRNAVESKSQFRELLKHMTFSEKITTIFPLMLLNYSRKIFYLSEKVLPGFMFKACKSLIKLLKPPAVQNSYTPLNPPPAYLCADAQPNRFSTILDVFEQIDPIDCSSKK